MQRLCFQKIFFFSVLFSTLTSSSFAEVNFETEVVPKKGKATVTHFGPRKQHTCYRFKQWTFAKIDTSASPMEQKAKIHIRKGGGLKRCTRGKILHTIALENIYASAEIGDFSYPYVVLIGAGPSGHFPIDVFDLKKRKFVFKREGNFLPDGWPKLRGNIISFWTEINFPSGCYKKKYLRKQKGFIEFIKKSCWRNFIRKHKTLRSSKPPGCETIEGMPTRGAFGVIKNVNLKNAKTWFSTPVNCEQTPS